MRPSRGKARASGLFLVGEEPLPEGDDALLERLRPSRIVEGAPPLSRGKKEGGAATPPSRTVLLMSAALRVSDDYASTSVRLPRQTITTLRRAAAERAIHEGERFSVSAVIADLVARYLAAPACDAAPIQQDDDDDRRRG
jgi:hypothetical protein